MSTRKVFENWLLEFSINYENNNSFHLMQRWKETILVPLSIMEISISESENNTSKRIKNL